ncbi:hypothetical protein BAUCODRAFT_122162 [Baudoinia panamericana UAMH 10762]|uniref:Zn(2)-C6 fungal-type domain-containing protein n=1 Tax=Baudoinia panamericana (strain UAMH 10762) TaxID=717646 RepID=M2MM29_BAUPA|nr:uncharacterized protein BAUCODRAFT_122162 [Baudoinia panamericana UAMH 10762]EMC97736.1 hypothetical protein BAUCODRAFT_122162 [Baudoinia panamericana UAMH 10762]
MSVISDAPTTTPTRTGALRTCEEQLSRLNQQLSAGFTAVNGYRHKAPPTSRSDPSAQDARPSDQTTSAEPPIDTPSATQETEPLKLGYSNDGTPALKVLAHGWRSDLRTSFPPQDSTATEAEKRKRSDSTLADDSRGSRHSQSNGDGPSSPKRRMTNIDSAIDLTSPDQQTQVPRAFSTDRCLSEVRRVATTSREPSPAQRHVRGRPVPPPRPEVEQVQEESLRRFLRVEEEAQQRAKAQADADAEAAAAQKRAQVEAEAQMRDEAKPRHHSPPDEEDDPMTPPEHAQNYQQHGYSPERNEQDYDAKRRKRNFSNRTKTGCHTCRRRKKKCDEAKPTCANCERSGHSCEGYGPKPLAGSKVQSAAKTPVALQAKGTTFEGVPQQVPTPYVQQVPVPESAPSYSHWGRIPSKEEEANMHHHHPLPPPQYPRYTSHEDSHAGHYGRPSVPRDPLPPYSNEPRYPPMEYSAMQPMHPMYAHSHPSHHPQPPLLPPPSSYGPPPPLLEPIPGDPYRHSMIPSAPVSSHDSNSHSSTSSLRTAALALARRDKYRLSEKEKMLLGEPFLAYVDRDLVSDRKECKAAVERYNDAAKASLGSGHGDRARLFNHIVDPTARPEERSRRRHPDDPYNGPKGSAGEGTAVETPFICDYGYNIHLGNKVHIHSGCIMSDPCRITIGDRTVIGPNVRFRGVTASLDIKARKGNNSCLLGGPIDIGEDCVIGSDVVILPFRTIGNGAVVGAGSVVTKVGLSIELMRGGRC